MSEYMNVNMCVCVHVVYPGYTNYCCYTACCCAFIHKHIHVCYICYMLHEFSANFYNKCVRSIVNHSQHAVPRHVRMWFISPLY